MSQSNGVGSSLSGLLSFCTLRLQEGEAAKEANREPQENRTSLKDVEAVSQCLRNGEYLPLLRAVCRPLEPGERLRFLRENAGMHGPLLLEQAAAEVADIVKNEALSKAAKIEAVQQRLPTILNKAKLAMYMLEFLVRNLSPKGFLEAEQIGFQRLFSNITEASARDIDCVAGCMKRCIKDDKMLVEQRLQMIYQRTISKLGVKYGLEDGLRESNLIPKGSNHQHFLDGHMMSRTCLKRLEQNEDLEGPSTWNEPQQRGRLRGFLSAYSENCRKNLHKAIEGYFSAGSQPLNSNDTPEEAKACLDGLLQRFEGGTLSADEVSIQAAPLFERMNPEPRASKAPTDVPDEATRSYLEQRRNLGVDSPESRETSAASIIERLERLSRLVGNASSSSSDSGGQKEDCSIM